MRRPPALVLLGAVLGTAAPALGAVAADGGNGARAPLMRPSPKLPVHIQADQLVAHAKGRSVRFSGHVHVAQAGYTLTCQRLTVFYGAGQKVERLIADGHVKVVQGDRVVTSDRAELDNRKRQLTFTGEPVITQGENVLRGQAVTLDLATNQVRVAQVRAKVRVGDLTAPGAASPAGRAGDGGAK